MLLTEEGRVTFSAKGRLCCVAALEVPPIGVEGSKGSSTGERYACDVSYRRL